MVEQEYTIKGKNYSNVFVYTNTDDDDIPAVRIAIHIVGGSAATTISMESAKQMIKALQAIVEQA